MSGLSTIVCGRIDPRYDAALNGVIHGFDNEKTLCGRYPRDTKSTLWFSKERITSDEHADCVTCKRCRKAMKLPQKFGDSLVPV